MTDRLIGHEALNEWEREAIAEGTYESERICTLIREVRRLREVVASTPEPAQCCPECGSPWVVELEEPETWSLGVGEAQVEVTTKVPVYQCNNGCFDDEGQVFHWTDWKAGAIKDAVADALTARRELAEVKGLLEHAETLRQTNEWAGWLLEWDTQEPSFTACDDQGCGNDIYAPTLLDALRQFKEQSK